MSAMERRKKKVSESPDALIERALKLLNDKNYPLSWETRKALIEPLLQAKHFKGPMKKAIGERNAD